MVVVRISGPVGAHDPSEEHSVVRASANPAGVAHRHDAHPAEVQRVSSPRAGASRTLYCVPRIASLFLTALPRCCPAHTRQAFMWERYHFFAAQELEHWVGCNVGCVIVPKKFVRQYEPR